MDLEHITTPFGRRSLSLASVAAQVAAREVEGKVAHKWKTFGAIAEARVALGVSDRTLAVLNALLTFMPETALSAGQLVVFPSNKALALRAHGMAEATLRRHLNALVQAGLVVRRDSPNGKRYARKGDDGAVEAAFGFDLSPILARAGEFEALAAKVAADRRAAAMARERVTILRRDVGKMIEAGATLGTPEQWAHHRDALSKLCHRLPRVVAPELVRPLVDELTALAKAVGKSLESVSDLTKLSGSAVDIDAHIQNSNTDAIIEIEPGSRQSQGGSSEPKSLPLGLVLRACPDVTMYDRDEVRSWRDLLGTVGLVRGILGISQSAWDEAREAMGDHIASATVAGILQRAEAIRSPGGYLRELTEKSRRGQFSVWPMMLALLRGTDGTASQPRRGQRERPERPGRTRSLVRDGDDASGPPPRRVGHA